MAIIFSLLLLSGSVLLYLSHRHQRWLTEPLAAWPSRGAGCLLVAAGLTCALATYSAITAICASLALLMLYWGVLPFIALTPLVPQHMSERLWKRQHGRRQHVRN